jgi:hypothetical protein
MLQVWNTLVKEARINYDLLLRQQRDHEYWKARIKSAWSRQELSQAEHHVFDAFYLLPPMTTAKDLAYAKKPSGSIIATPTGTYDVPRHYGYGNFCVNNGVLYSTVGTDLYSYNLSTGAMAKTEYIAGRKYCMEITWESFPPDLGDEFYWHHVLRTVDRYTVYPVSNGNFVTYKAGTYYDKGEYTSYDSGLLVYWNSDFTSAIKTIGLNMNVVRPDQIAIIGETAYLFYATTQSRVQRRSSVQKRSYSYIVMDLNTGLQLGAGTLLPGLFKAAWARSFQIYGNYRCRLTTRGPINIYFNTYEEFTEYQENPPDTLRRSLGTGYDPAKGQYYVIATFYAVDMLGFGATTQTRGAWGSVAASQIATLGSDFAVYDSVSNVIRIMTTGGELKRIISFDWCDHFFDGQIDFKLDTTYVQISVDPYDNNYIYVLFNGYSGIQPGRLVGRLKIGTD